MRKNIFITGATGLLASNLTKILLDKKGNYLYLLIRNKDNRSALERKKILINKLFSKTRRRKAASKIYVVEGDISKHNLGLNKKDLRNLGNTINTVYHSAAISSFSHNLSTIRKVNVGGVENLLKLALDWQKRGSLENVNHISTVYIAGNYTGTFYEKDRDVRQKFNNTYEQSKFEAELLIEKYRKKGLCADIYRPSIITDTIAPSVNITTGLLWLLEVGILETFTKIPADGNTRLNMIPIDAVSEAIYLISTTKNRPLNCNYHIVNPKPIKLDILLKTASKFFGFKKPKCLPATKFNMRELSLIQHKIIEHFVPYINQKLSFDMQNTNSILKKYNFRIPSINKESLNKVLKHYSASSPIARRRSYAFKK